VIVQLAISRKREYAADAYAVRLTAYNKGLASALAKIGGVSTYSNEQRENLGGNNLASMYIYYPAHGGSKKSLFSTHPPIEDRINKLLNMY
jgi:heat shock protein HtpX